LDAILQHFSGLYHQQTVEIARTPVAQLTAKLQTSESIICVKFVQGLYNKQLQSQMHGVAEIK